MYTLHFFRSSSALAAQILLEEIGAPYTTNEVSIPKGEHRAPTFLAINPKGRIPVLETPEGTLTENPAILEYLAASHPDAGLVPTGLFQQAQARSLCAYLCATAHIAFAHKQRGRRWVDTDDAIPAMQAKVSANMAECAEVLENHIVQGPWAMGAQYSFCDPYLFLMERWLAGTDVPLKSYPKLSAHFAAMRERPATQTVLEAYGLS